MPVYTVWARRCWSTDSDAGEFASRQIEMSEPASVAELRAIAVTLIDEPDEYGFRFGRDDVDRSDRR